MNLPFTERSNPLTTTIDALPSAADIVNTLGKVDQEIFVGPLAASAKTSAAPSPVPAAPPDPSSLLGRRNIFALNNLADLIGYAIEQNRLIIGGASDYGSRRKFSKDEIKFENRMRLPFGVVFAGCGTSGRVAFLCARQFDKLFCNDAEWDRCGMTLRSSSMFRYAMAAGDDALTLSIELPEDDPLAGVAALRKFEDLFQHIIVVGITCGLSAPFVAGMLDFARHNSKSIDKDADWHPASSRGEKGCATSYTACLMGFNPVSMARDSVIEKWDTHVSADGKQKTCREVFETLAEGWDRSVALRESAFPVPSDKVCCGGCCGGGGGGSSATPAEQPDIPVSCYAPDSIIITPIVGAEAITGSSRMKGGSATMVMLCAVGAAAFARATARRKKQEEAEEEEGKTVKKADAPSNSTHVVAGTSVSVHLRRFQTEALAAVYGDPAVAASLGGIAEAAASTVQRGGRVVYVGLDKGGSAGALGMMDASEMVDTYGCPEDEWRALTLGGWDALRNQDGDRSKQQQEQQQGETTTNDKNNNLLDIAAENGGAEKWLRKGDVLILLDIQSDGNENSDDDGFFGAQLSDFALEKGCAVKCITVWNCKDDEKKKKKKKKNGNDEHSCHIDLHNSGNLLSTRGLSYDDSVSYAFFDCVAEFCMKLATNAVSTAAQILRGAVFSNRMINVTVSNNKLFFRTLQMVMLFSGEKDEEAAKRCLLRAIYRDEKEEVHHQTAAAAAAAAAGATVADHVIAATPVKNVLPVATLLAAGAASSPAEALRLLESAGTLRNAMRSVVEGRGRGKGDHQEQQKEQKKKENEHSDNKNEILAERKGFIMRAAQWPRDLEGVYHVCLKTGDHGADGEPFYKEDPDALGRVYCGPYLKFETNFALVLENKEKPGVVAGYTFGALDTADFFLNKYDKQWRPEIAAMFPDPAAAIADASVATAAAAAAAAPTAKENWTRSQKMHHIYHNPDFREQMESVDLKLYPSHLHIDLLEEARGCGLGRSLIGELLRRLKQAGSPGVHLCMAADNDNAFGFYKKLGFEQVNENREHKYLAKKL